MEEYLHGKHILVPNVNHEGIILGITEFSGPWGPYVVAYMFNTEQFIFFGPSDCQNGVVEVIDLHLDNKIPEDMIKIADISAEEMFQNKMTTHVGNLKLQSDEMNKGGF